MTDAAPKRQEVKHLFSSPNFSTSTPTPRPYFTIEPIIPRHHAQVLPDEITRELESLSHVDKERTSRIAKLEKWRKGVEDVLPVEAEVDEIEEQASKVKNNVLPESAESSVEGLLIIIFCLIYYDASGKINFFSEKDENI